MTSRLNCKSLIIREGDFSTRNLTQEPKIVKAFDVSCPAPILRVAEIAPQRPIVLNNVGELTLYSLRGVSKC